MRFFGGGIGHKATYKYTAALRTDALAMVNTYSNSAGAVDDELQVVSEGEEARFAETTDYGYELGEEEEDCESNDEDNGANLGAEDGEDLQAEGYGEL